MLFKPKIAAVISKGGCDYWRTFLPLEAMRKQGLAEVRYVDARSMTGKELGEAAHWCDILHIRGLIGTEGLQMLKQYKDLGVLVVSDYDDLHFNVSPFNPAYKHFGTEEVQVKDPTTGDIKFLWKDGVDGFDLKANQVKFHSYVKILQELDLITTTTLYLKDAMNEISGAGDRIRVLPNALDLTQWKPLDVRDKLPGKFRFGWAVSNSHAEDWLFIQSVIKDFLNKHKDAVFVCIGDTSINITSILPKDQVEWYVFSDLWEGHYPMRMAMLGLDCAIAPLADLEFNRCKSPLKYEEYAAFGYPVIAQNMTPYREHIIHGETGLLAGSKENWKDCLEMLYKDETLRNRLRFNAMLDVKNNYDVNKIANEWAEVYRQLLAGEASARSK